MYDNREPVDSPFWSKLFGQLVEPYRPPQAQIDKWYRLLGADKDLGPFDFAKADRTVTLVLAAVIGVPTVVALCYCVVLIVGALAQR